MTKRRLTWASKMRLYGRLTDYNESQIHIMYSCRWELLKIMLTFDDDAPKTRIGRILYEDNEESLLEAISSDEVFGFVVADVRTPDKVMEKYKDFLFPPVFRHGVIDEDMLSPYMKQRVAEEGRKLGEKTVLQCYNADQLLIMTPMVKFYLEEGIIVKNVTKFYQYQPGKSLLPFQERVYNLRVAATYEKDESKQLSAKLVGNSGKFFMVKLSNCFYIFRVR